MRSSLRLLALLWATAILGCPAEKRNYTGYQVQRFVPQNSHHMSVLTDQLFKNSAKLGLDFWVEPSKIGRPVDILIPPIATKGMSNMASKLGMGFKLLIEDVQSLIDSQAVAPKGTKLTWDQYYETEDVFAWTEEMRDAFPDIVTLEQIGESYEGREMRLMRINKPSDQEKTVIFIESQIHAREWITTATTTWMFNELLNNPEYAEFLDTFDFHYVPVVNPDGVAYTHSNDRLWRKTRSDYGDGCFGSDPNRNWDASFGGPGTSDDPCSEIYHGPFPFSESEVKAVSDYIMANKDAIAAFFDIHSYSQFVLLPWGDTSDLPEDYDELLRIGKVFEDHVKIPYGTEYITGNIADVIYLAAGGSVDWVKATPQIKYSHALELRDTGDYGFLLPADQIIPSGEETLLGFLAQIQAIRAAVLAKKE